MQRCSRLATSFLPSAPLATPRQQSDRPMCPMFGAPAICAGIAVLAYRAVSTGVPVAVGGVAFLTLGQQTRHRPLSAQPQDPTSKPPGVTATQDS
jgi:hypothetical protein